MEWQRGQPSEQLHSEVEPMHEVIPAKEVKPRSFEYTGNRSLKIKGAMTGKTYYFRFKGHILVVEYADTFSMMAEHGIQVVKNTPDTIGTS